MSLNRDVTSIEAVLNPVGASVFQSQNRQPKQGLRTESEVAADTNRYSHGSSDLGSRLAQGSAADLDALNEDGGTFGGKKRSAPPDSMEHNGTSTKRKCVSSTSEKEQQMDRLFGNQKGHSRDLMPPPPVPHRQPYVYFTQVPEPNLDELLGQGQETDASQWPLASFMFDRQAQDRELIRQFDAARVNMPVTPAHIHNPPPPNLTRSIPHTPIAAGPPRESAWPQGMVRAYDAQHGGSQSSSRTASSSRNSRQRRPETLDQGSLQFPLDMDVNDSTHSVNRRRFGPASSLGLSSNARSSSHRPSQSSANPSIHRQRLGEEPSTSPHFPPIGLSNSALRPPYGRFPGLTRLRSYPSDMNTLNGSTVPSSNQYDRIDRLGQDRRSSHERAIQRPLASDTTNLLTSTAPGPAPHNNTLPTTLSNRGGPNRGRAVAAGPQAPSPRRPDQSRGRLPTADPAASALRRRANR